MLVGGDPQRTRARNADGGKVSGRPQVRRPAREVVAGLRSALEAKLAEIERRWIVAG